MHLDKPSRLPHFPPIGNKISSKILDLPASPPRNTTSCPMSWSSRQLLPQQGKQHCNLPSIPSSCDEQSNEQSNSDQAHGDFIYSRITLRAIIVCPVMN